MASEWADIRHAREAEEKKREAKKQQEERKKRIDAMVEESEGVAMNIAKAEKAIKTAAEGKKAAASWMDVVMG